jgi:hypothetical protein
LVGVGSFARVHNVKVLKCEENQSDPLHKEYKDKPLALKEFSKAYIVSHDDAELANCEVIVVLKKFVFRINILIFPFYCDVDY